MGKCYRAELVGAFGCPIDENPTAVLEEAAFAAKGLFYRYLTIKVERDDLKAAMEAVRALNMRGINLTIPHKVRAVDYIDELSPAAGIIGAVNVVVNNKGRLWGDNTDGKGFMTSLEERGISVKGKKLTILGAGGAARAIGVECALSGAAEINVAGIIREQGEELSRLICERTPAKGVFIPWEGRAGIPAGTDILVNATPVGLYPDVDSKPEIDYDGITRDMVVCDVIFNDPRTLFLHEAEIRGAETVNGLGMLVNQGALNFTLWTGAEAPKDVMTEALKKEFGL